MQTSISTLIAQSSVRRPGFFTSTWQYHELRNCKWSDQATGVCNAVAALYAAKVTSTMAVPILG
jgi:hypothetical protein